MKGSLKMLAEKYWQGILKVIENKMSKIKSLSVIQLEKTNKRRRNVE